MLDLILQSKAKNLGGDFTVRRALPTLERKMLGPFIFFDHMGPVDFEIGNGMDVRPHPHIGLSTLTYLFEGEAVHRDTLGVEQVIAPGDVNWMTAGSGVAHSERSSRESRMVQQRLHGIQTWIALPKELEELKASFFHHNKKDIPEISHKGQAIRVIAGNFENINSPVSTHSPLTYLDIKLAKNETFEMQKENQELGVYCVSGILAVGEKVIGEGALGIFHKSDKVQVLAKESARFLILGGEVFPEQRHIWWNFVSSSKERIELAKDQWKKQKFGMINGESEFIPLPEK